MNSTFVIPSASEGIFQRVCTQTPLEWRFAANAKRFLPKTAIFAFTFSRNRPSTHFQMQTRGRTSLRHSTARPWNLFRFHRQQPEEFRDEIFRLLFEYADFSTFAPDDKIKYINDMTTERDIHNQIEYAHDKGYEQGERKGIEKGAKEERAKHHAEILQIAKSLRASGMLIEEVARHTGLSPEEISSIK